MSSFMSECWRRRRAHARNLHTVSALLVICAGCILACGGKNSTSSKTGGPHLKWQFKSAAPALSHPALGADGAIYVGSNRALQAISPDGKLLWEIALNGAGTPIIADEGTIYLDSSHGSVFGVNKEGKLLWHPGYGLISFGAPPALGADSALFYLNNVGDIYAFQPKRSDEKLWSLDTFREGMLGASTVLPGSAHSGGVLRRAAPLLTTSDSVLLPRQNFLDSVSTSGSLEWDLELTSGNLGQAALGADGTIYVGDDQNVFYAVSSSGFKKWQFDAGGSVVGSPVVDGGGVIYFVDGIAIFALNPDGSLKWRYAPPQRVNLSTGPALAMDGTIYVGGEFALLALKPDGSLKWNLRVFSPTSSPTIASDGTIYFACGYSALCAVEDSGSPLMHSAWPKQFHDSANSSNPLHGFN
jgi:outer membrane protein assembly factor BamB